MSKREYCLRDGYLYLSNEIGAYSVVYNKDKTKCICLTTGCEFNFNGNDRPKKQTDILVVCIMR